METLINIKDPAMIQSGIFRNLAAGQNGLWKDAYNVNFVDGAVEKTQGWSQTIIMPEQPIAITQAYVDGEKRIYVGSEHRLEMVKDGLLTNLGFGYTSTNEWSLVTWGTWLIGTNNRDTPKVWKNAGLAVNLGMPTVGADLPTTFKIMAKSNQHLLGYQGQTLYFTSKSKPEEWDPTPSNNAGSLFIRNADSDIIAVKPLGNGFGVYTNDSLLLQQYVGAPNYFGFSDKILNGIGAISQDSIVPVSNRHYGMNLGGFFTTDGITFNYLDHPMVNRWYKANFDTTKAHLAVGFHIEALNVVRWAFDCKDGIRRGLDYNYQNSSWTVHYMPIVAADERQVLDYPIVAEGLRLGTLGDSYDRGPINMPSFLETFPFDAGQRQRFKDWKCLQVNEEHVGNFQLRFGFSNTHDEAVEWEDWRTVQLENWIDRQSVLLTIQFQSTGGGADWRLGTMEVLGYMGGML